jgi:hypothetical protein
MKKILIRNRRIQNTDFTSSTVEVSSHEPVGDQITAHTASLMTSEPSQSAAQERPLASFITFWFLIRPGAAIRCP